MAGSLRAVSGRRPSCAGGGGRRRGEGRRRVLAPGADLRPCTPGLPGSGRAAGTRRDRSRAGVGAPALAPSPPRRPLASTRESLKTEHRAARTDEERPEPLPRGREEESGAARGPRTPTPPPGPGGRLRGAHAATCGGRKVDECGEDPQAAQRRGRRGRESSQGIAWAGGAGRDGGSGQPGLRGNQQEARGGGGGTPCTEAARRRQEWSRAVDKGQNNSLCRAGPPTRLHAFAGHVQRPCPEPRRSAVSRRTSLPSRGGRCPSDSCPASSPPGTDGGGHGSQGTRGGLTPGSRPPVRCVTLSK